MTKFDYKGTLVVLCGGRVRTTEIPAIIADSESTPIRLGKVILV